MDRHLCGLLIRDHVQLRSNYFNRYIYVFRTAQIADLQHWTSITLSFDVYRNCQRRRICEFCIICHGKTGKLIWMPSFCVGVRWWSSAAPQGTVMWGLSDLQDTEARPSDDLNHPSESWKWRSEDETSNLSIVPKTYSLRSPSSLNRSLTYTKLRCNQDAIAITSFSWISCPTPS